MSKLWIHHPARALLVAAATVATMLPAAATPIPTGNPYLDGLLVGSFGSVSHAYINPVQKNDVNPLALQSSVSMSRYDQNTGVDLSAEASNSHLDGALHVRTAASSCAQRCIYGYRAASAGTAYWETLSLDIGSTPGPVHMALKVDGFTQGGAWARIRYFVGNSHIDTDYLNRQPSLGWKSLVTTGNDPAEWRFDLGEVEVRPGLDAFLFVEVEALSFAIGSGDSLADFGHTVRFEWQRPEGMVLKSASGVFMTSAVPEPSTAALSLLGAAGLLVLRRSRRQPPVNDASSPRATD